VKRGLMRALEMVWTVFGLGSASACGLAVEKTIKISPDPFPEIDPVRASPNAALRASRLSW
jgi:hypothetical protein